MRPEAAKAKYKCCIIQLYCFRAHYCLYNKIQAIEYLRHGNHYDQHNDAHFLEYLILPILQVISFLIQPVKIANTVPNRKKSRSHFLNIAMINLKHRND